MARTESTMLALGAEAPEFNLINTLDGKMISLNDVKGEKGTLVMFICNHCPFVKHLQDHLKQLNPYLEKGLGVAAISSNDVEHYPDDSPDKMKIFAEAHDFQFPYLYDETQEVAKAYEAACTPDFMLFDEDLKCVYRGRYDASSPGNGVPVSGDELFAAISALLTNNEVPTEQYPSIGCNIKWKAI